MGIGVKTARRRRTLKTSPKTKFRSADVASRPYPKSAVYGRKCSGFVGYGNIGITVEPMWEGSKCMCGCGGTLNGQRLK